MDPSPEEIDFDIIAKMHDLDSPELLRLKVLHAQIPLNHEPQSGKLAGACCACQGNELESIEGPYRS